MIKRTFDIAVAVCALIPASIIMLMLALAIRLDSPGPAFFGQGRIGRHGRQFACYKLRTMRVGAPEGGTHDVPREFVTRVGGFIRRTKLDELPQLWNVLTGDMSIVGPRPSLPSQTRIIELRQQLGILSARPGITGLAQVNGVDMSTPESLAALDAQYLKHAGLWTDIKILLLTFARHGRSDQELI